MRSEYFVAATCAGTSSRTASASTSLSVTSTAPRQRVVLAWLSGRPRHARVGRVVGEDRHLGGTRLRVDADQPAEQPLARRHVDVARAGDQPVGAGAVRRTPAMAWAPPTA